MKPVYLVTYRGKWLTVPTLAGVAALAFGTKDEADDYVDRAAKVKHTTRRRFKVIPFRKA